VLCLYSLHSVCGLHGLQSAESAFWGDPSAALAIHKKETRKT